jgi:hypothetical protein
MSTNSRLSPAALDYFRLEYECGRGERIGSIAYVVVSSKERTEFPELLEFYAVAIEELPTIADKAQSWLMTEQQYDDDVIAALSTAASAADRSTRH